MGDPGSGRSLCHRGWPAHRCRRCPLARGAAVRRARRSGRRHLPPRQCRACRRDLPKLDGIPLAMQEAAAGVHAFGLQGLQTIGSAAGRRQARRETHDQTLHATLEWSWPSVGAATAPAAPPRFAGHFPLSALVAVACAQDLGAAEAKYVVADLVDKCASVRSSMATTSAPGCSNAAVAYARDKLGQAGERHDNARRHARFCLQTFHQERPWCAEPLRVAAAL